MNTLSKLNPWNVASSWDPFRELEEMQNRLTSFFGRRLPLVKGGTESEEFTLTTWAPRVDIAEDDKEYVIKAELPGVKKDEVKVSVENGVLSISGERKTEKEEKGKKYHRIEQSYGTFLRSFILPEGASGEKISAEFRDGILEVHVPKDEKARPKAIEVKIG
ncbi:MAG TPA: Hsp20/alpha crystallin family protein [Chthoniobacterales bacterium]|nr:Hsp20/alpha crystallin family protein [Verrucomicrobiota bacterium]HTD15593.1 Hsp20/alpha crystallin family protein [Chthoniobacterales bacterium]